MASTVPPPSGQTTAICGFDVGSENCYIAVARAGGIEILLNEYSQRSTPAYIGFGSNQRELGVSAKQKQMMNLSNTCFAPNRLIGQALKELPEEYPFRLEAAPNGEVLVRVWHNGEEQVFTAVQVMAMLFTKLRQVSSNSIDCVINCPIYFTDSQRRSLMDAAVIAGLNPIRIIPDMTATSLYYGFYRTAPSEQEAIIVAFVDIGHSSTQCSIVLFNNKEHYMKVLAMEYEINLGGKHFDELIANYFIQKQNLKLNKRSRFRLIAECEKLKKNMSANSNDLPINIECLYDERDFSDKMDRTLFEQLAEPLLLKINDVFVRALKYATDKFTADNNNGKLGEFRIDSCEIVGGSSRVPAIKRSIKATFGVEASTTVNADEAVSRGCALQCAMLSPTFKVARQMQVCDFNPYQIDFRYWSKADAGNPNDFKTVRALFPRGHQMPFSKQIAINCQSLPLIAAFDYVNDSKQVIPIGEFKISSSEQIQINKNQIKVRVRLDPNGIVLIQSATILIEGNIPKKNGDSVEDIENSTEEQQNSQPQPMDTDEQTTPPAEQNENSVNHQEGKGARKSKKSKPTSVELQIEPLCIRGKLTESEILKYKEVELNLVLADKNWKEKTDAKNTLEEYVYEWRDKMESDGYDPFVESDQKQSFLNQLQTTEQWLYEQEEADQLHSKSVYEENLGKLRQSFSDGIVLRKREFENRPTHLERLGNRLQQARKLLDEYKEQTDSAKALHEDINAKQKWLDDTFANFQAMRTTSNPTITCDQISQQTSSLDSSIRQVTNERNRRNEEKRKQAEAAKQAPPPPANDQQNPSSEQNASQPQMEVDPDIAPTI